MAAITSVQLSGDGTVSRVSQSIAHITRNPDHSVWLFMYPMEYYALEEVIPSMEDRIIWQCDTCQIISAQRPA